MMMSEDKILKYCIKYDAICKFCPRQLQCEKEIENLDKKKEVIKNEINKKEYSRFKRSKIQSKKKVNYQR